MKKWEQPRVRILNIIDTKSDTEVEPYSFKWKCDCCGAETGSWMSYTDAIAYSANHYKEYPWHLNPNVCKS